MRQACVIVVVIVTFVFVAACDHHDGHHDHSDHGDAYSHADHEHPSESSQDTNQPIYNLQLDGANKWTMDDHTRKTFLEMSARFQGLNPHETSQNDLRTLGSNLEKDLESLIAGCTMQGAAHEELHKYLTAYMPAVRTLTAEGSPENATRVISLLELFPNYFE